MSTVVPCGGPLGASTDWSFTVTTEVLLGGMGWTNSAPGSEAAMAFGSTEVGVFDRIGLTAVKHDVNGIHAGIALRPVPKPSSFVLAALGHVAIVSCILCRRRRIRMVERDYSTGASVS